MKKVNKTNPAAELLRGTKPKKYCEKAGTAYEESRWGLLSPL